MDTIKMSSTAAAINIYKNMESEAVLNSMENFSNEFSRPQQLQI